MCDKLMLLTMQIEEQGALYTIALCMQQTFELADVRGVRIPAVLHNPRLQSAAAAKLQAHVSCAMPPAATKRGMFTVLSRW